MIEFKTRKTPPHYPLRDNKIPKVIFLTICTRDKKKILDNEESHKLLINSWTISDHWLVGKYIIMPEHIHMFCSPNDDYDTTLGNWIKFWKRQVSLSWTTKGELPLWQIDFWDRQIRSYEHFYQKWDYIKENPVYRGLVIDSNNWKYQGQLNTLF